MPARMRLFKNLQHAINSDKTYLFARISLPTQTSLMYGIYRVVQQQIKRKSSSRFFYSSISFIASFQSTKAEDYELIIDFNNYALKVEGAV